MTASPRQHPRRGAAFGKAVCRSPESRDSHRKIRIRNRCGGQQPFLLREQKREEAATPGQPAALARRTGGFPRRLTLANHRLPLALPQSSGKVRNTHVSLQPTLRHIVASINIKSALDCAEPVDVETSLWSHEENLDSSGTARSKSPGFSVTYKALSCGFFGNDNSLFRTLMIQPPAKETECIRHPPFDNPGCRRWTNE